jgi:hypothetical protein
VRSEHEWHDIKAAQDYSERDLRRLEVPGLTDEIHERLREEMRRPGAVLACRDACA